MTTTHTVTQVTFSKENILKSIPKEAFEKSDAKAYQTIAKVFATVSLSIAFLIWAPWYLVPLAWVVLGTALTGLITIAHDCGHEAFFADSGKNQLFGSLAYLLLLYPLESWKLHHNKHHAHAEERSHGNYPAKVVRVKRLFNPLIWIYFVGIYFVRYFDLQQFSAEQQTKSRISILSVQLFSLVLFTTLFYTVGFWGIVKYWVIPWLIVHFWKNTLRQYIVNVVDIKNEKLIHYRYPMFVEFFSCDANYLVPHYLSTAIPSYNYRIAHDALFSSEWGRYFELRNWAKLLKDPPKENKSAKKSEKFKLIPFLASLNWLHIIIIVGLPIIGSYGAVTTEWDPRTLIFAFCFYIFSGLGITAGYHRLWAHRAYDASWPVRIGLLLGGTAAVEGSIRWWCRDHRAHHRYTDTSKDPYSAKEGFFYSHVGWMLKRQDPKKIGFADISDLNADPLIRWQHRNYLWFAVLLSFVLPTMFCGLGWGDFRGGFFIAGVLRLLFVHHATFCINSLAHTIGAQTYDDKHTPRDSVVTAFFTFGEGYHNFHHEFPNDYRNGIRFYDYDPTKWLIRGLAFFGLTYNLKVFPSNEIDKGKAQMAEKKIRTIKEKLLWGPDVNSLPLWTKDDLAEFHKGGKKSIIIDGVVHDVTVFVNNHPGGSIIKSYLGVDATAVFYGGVYDHSNAARNLLSTMRLARYEPTEDEIAKIVDEEPAHHKKTH